MAVALKLFGLACGVGLVGGGVPLILKSLKNSTESNLEEKRESSDLTAPPSETTSSVPTNNPSLKEEKSEKETITNQEPEETVTVREQEPQKTIIPVKKVEAGGNCVVLDNSQEIIDVLWHFSQLEADYTAISCQKTNEEAGVKISDWRGIFHDDFLLNSWNLKAGDRFNVVTETQILDSGNYQTIFEGNRMEHSITGEWGDPITTDKGKSVTVVKVPEDSKLIYLLFEGESIQKDK